MSLLDKIPLPNVVVPPAQPAPPVAPVEESKRFIIIYSKEIPEDEKAVLKQFGSVVEWKEQFVNLPFDKLAPFDYLLIDARVKNARLTLGREDLSRYNTVCYVSWVQKGIETFIDQVSGIEITSIPKQCVNKQDLDIQLLNEKIVSPSLIKSFFLLFLACLRKWEIFSLICLTIISKPNSLIIC